MLIGGLAMKFERLTNEDFGAQNAGYRFDFSQPQIIDDDVRALVLRERDESYLSSCIDGFCDFEGDLHRGDDGELYVVGYAYVDDFVPLVWRRVVKAD